METSVLVNLIQTAGYEAYSYSGRGMLGRKCVGLTCPDVNTAIADLFEAVFDASGDNDECMDIHTALCEVIRKSASDSMGLDKVLYFKSVEWQDE
jgi:hypothetical protein